MPLTRRSLLAGSAATTVAAALSSTLSRIALAGGSKPNVLFVSIDDLNDWGGVLGGHPQARTPFLDRLASRGLSFGNAQCAAPVCNPSRVAILTGKRPSTTGVYSNQNPLRLAMPDAVTLPQQLHQHGYQTFGCGKVFHAGDPASWDVAYPKSGCGRPPDAKRAFPKRSDRPLNGIKGSRIFDWGPGPARQDDAYSDARVADQVIDWIKADHDRPFFIGCGFFRPHLPWFVPKSYFDLYPLDSIILPTVTANDLDDIPQAGRVMAHIEDHLRITGAGKWPDAVQAYLASLSFSDAQLGRVLDGLVDAGHAHDTIVIAWSDHGWSLGTKQHWKKFALWEECTRVPLIMKVPGLTTKGSTCQRPVNLVDLYPTVLDLCGLPVREDLEGNSLKPLLEDPGATWDQPSLTTHERGNHALRSERWRYIRYADGSEELYDHDVDPEEWTNLASDDRTTAVKTELARWFPAVDAATAPTGKHPCKAEGY